MQCATVITISPGSEPQLPPGSGRRESAFLAERAR
jgi:hypothetical protein